MRADPARYIGSDIVEKVLLRDLPSLYGIQDVQELNRLFTLLAYNTAGEVSLGGLSQDSQVSKQTLNRYIEYLEAAFLIKRVNRVDDNARRFKRARNFKIYVTTPSLRTALFGPVTARSSEMGALAETAVFSQWFHSNVELHYARWKSRQREGEVDIVHLDARQKPHWCVEVKWSDRAARAPQELKSLLTFSRKHPGLRGIHLTSRTVAHENLPWPGDGVLNVGPVAFYCYVVGWQGVLDPESRWLPIFSTAG